MDTISCKRFRRFEHLEPLTLKDVNFFVGPNNSGKSTVVKALLLIEDNLKKFVGLDPVTKLPLFDLTSEYAHIGDFKRACHRNGTGDDNDGTFELAWTEKDESVSITLCNSSIGSMYACYQSIEYSKSKDNLHFLVDFKNRKFYYSVGENDDDENMFDNDSFNKIVDRYKVLEQLDEYVSENKRKLEVEYRRQQNDEIGNRIEKCKQKLSDIAAAFDETKNNLKKLLEATGNNEMRSVSRCFSFSNNQEDYGKGTFVFRIWKNVFPDITDALNEDLRLIKNLCRPETKATFANFKGGLYGLPNFETRFEYLYAHHVHQNSVYSTLDKNDYTAYAIDRYYKFFLAHKKVEDLNFVSDWLKFFEIGEDIKIQPMPGGELYTASLVTKNGEMPLQDLGMGTIQIVVMLLRFAVITRDINDFIMIEEPEQNLHPKLQSKLADLFLCVHIMRDAKLIVETHSECLIRRTQYLLAQGSFKVGRFIFNVKNDGKNPFQIHYFPSDGQPYPMEFQESGLFANQFGEGFFDESSNLLLSVLSNARNQE